MISQTYCLNGEKSMQNFGRETRLKATTLRTESMGG
jgi:hypothetical protein